MNMNFFKLDPEIQAAKLIGGFIHVSGLSYKLFPFGKALCVMSYPDKILFRYSKETQFELPKEKISNMYLYSYSSEKAKIESSFLKAVAGAALFGAAGAIIGAMPEQKQKNVNHAYLVIQYTKDAGQSYIVFDATDSVNWSECLIKSLGFSKKQHRTITL